MLLDTEDGRLTTRERRELRQIVLRLEAKPYLRNLREPIPQAFQRKLEAGIAEAIEQVFGER
jgi:hypothetical protein